MPRRRDHVDPLGAWEAAQQTLAEGETEAARINFVMTLADLGQHTTFTATGHPAAILPHVPHLNDPAKQLQLEKVWEAKSVAMHQQQHLLDLPSKPNENRLRRAPNLVRGD